MICTTVSVLLQLSIALGYKITKVKDKLKARKAQQLPNLYRTDESVPNVSGHLLKQLFNFMDSRKTSLQTLIVERD